MRFFGAPTVLLALGVSAVAGHSYHAFGHGYEPAAGYGLLQKHSLYDSHVDVPYGSFTEVPTYYGGIEDVQQDHGYVSYSEPHDDHNGHELLDDHRYKELHDYGHQDHHEHHENYVVHDNQEHHVHHDHDHKEELEHQDNHAIYEHHGNHEIYEHLGNHEIYEHHGNNDHVSHVSHEQHEDEKHDDGHGDVHNSEPNYEFKYGVNDPKTGDFKEQWESRAGDKVKGGYSLKEADGTTRVVHYSADKKTGFEATVHKIGHSEEKHSEHDHYVH